METKLSKSAETRKKNLLDSISNLSRQKLKLELKAVALEMSLPLALYSKEKMKSFKQEWNDLRIDAFILDGIIKTLPKKSKLVDLSFVNIYLKRDNMTVAERCYRALSYRIDDKIEKKHLIKNFDEMLKQDEERFFFTKEIEESFPLFK